MLTNDIIKEILKNIRFRNAGIESDSYYLLNTNNRGKPIQIRVSNHGTYLRTWVDMANGKDSNMRLIDPSASINISIVFIDKGDNLTKDCIGQSDCENCGEEICKPSIVQGITSKNRQYTVLQYTYQSEMINSRYLKSIINAIKRASIGGRYIDPLNSIQMKRAKVKSMTTHDNITEDNNLKLQYKMKKRIRLTEGDLRSVIRQQVRNILRESVDSVSPQPFDGDSSVVGQEDTAFMDKIRPYRLKSRDWSAIGFLNKMRDRIYTARYRNDGMQGLLDDLEELIDDCEEKVRKEANY